MTNNALYVYGIVKFGFDLWKGKGINGKDVYPISKNGFSALVHECQAKPYTSEDPEKIKDLILAHNKVLDRAMEDFNGVIPLPFNTIIKRGKNTMQYNLKKWLNDDKEKLEKIWNKIRGKKEYGLRIYYEKDKLIQEVSGNREIEKIKRIKEGKSQGLSYLLEGKIKSEINEAVQNKINLLKQRFYEDLKKFTKDVIISTPRTFINEEKDLLLSLSILVNEQRINKIKKDLQKKVRKDFPFNLAGPFAPYSFVENGTKL